MTEEAVTKGTSPVAEGMWRARDARPHLARITLVLAVAAACVLAAAGAGAEGSSLAGSGAEKKSGINCAMFCTMAIPSSVCKCRYSFFTSNKRSAGLNQLIRRMRMLDNNRHGDNSAASAVDYYEY